MTDPTDPLVTTDQQDYAPGSTATISASGFGAGDDLQFQITVIDPTTTGAAPYTWGVNADGSGGAVTSFFVSSIYANTTMLLTVTDAATGQVVQEVFTDGSNNPPNYDTNDGDPGARTSPANIIDLTAATPSNVVSVGPSSTPVDTNGAIWTSAQPLTSAGVLQAFERLQSDGNEASTHGYNTGATSSNGQFLFPLDDKTVVGNGNLASPIVNVDNLATVTENGHTYYEFILTTNNSGQNISVDAVQIFEAGSATLTGTTSAASNGEMNLSLPGAQLVWSLQQNEPTAVNLSPSDGSAHGDTFLLVPTADFTAHDYVYLYSAFGQENPVQGGYEQWGALTKDNVAVYDWSFAKYVQTVASPSADDSVASDQGIITNSTNASLTAIDGDQNQVDHAGQTITYQLQLANDGQNDPISNITVTDALLNGNLPETVGSTTITDIHGQTETISFAGDANNNGVLDPGETWTWTFTYKPTQADIDNNGTDGHGNIINSATVSTSDAAAEAGLPAGTNPNTASATVQVDQDPDLSVAKSVTGIDDNPTDVVTTADGNVHGAGDVIDYSVVVTNTGNVDLAGANLDVADLTGLTLSSGDDGSHILKVGQSWTYTGTHTVTQQEIDSGANIVNTVTVTDSTDKVAQDGDDTSSVSTAVDPIGKRCAGPEPITVHRV